jgi:hypothetical protein
MNKRGNTRNKEIRFHLPVKGGGGDTVGRKEPRSAPGSSDGVSVEYPETPMTMTGRLVAR